MTCTRCPAQLWGYEVAQGVTLCRTCRKGPVKAPKVDHDADALALVKAASAAARAEGAQLSRAQDDSASTAALLELVSPARPQSRVGRTHRLGPVAGYSIHELTPAPKVSVYRPGVAANLQPKRQSGDRGWVQGAYSSNHSTVAKVMRTSVAVTRELKCWK